MESVVKSVENSRKKPQKGRGAVVSDSRPTKEAALSGLGQLIMRSNIDLEAKADDVLFTSAPISPFKSQFNSMVTHMTYVFSASDKHVKIFDGDGHELAQLKVEIESQAKQIIRSTMKNDPAFYLICESELA